MDIIHFNRHIDRLKQAYNDKAFSKEKVKLIWKYVENLDNEYFDKMVDNILETSRYAPLPGDFKEGLRSVIKHNAEDHQARIMERVDNQPLCKRCGNSGILFGWSIEGKTKGYSFNFNCTYCRVANIKGEQFPEYSETKHVGYSMQWDDVTLDTEYEARKALWPISPVEKAT